eukprot:413392-Prymnesium_polylepis.1
MGEIGHLALQTDRLARLIDRLQGTVSRDGDCDLETMRRENERLLGLLRAHPPPRPSMLPQRRLRIAAAQGWRCAICNETLTEVFHADHRIPWALSFDDSDANIQICCVRCHTRKTSEEASCKRRHAV